MESILLILIPFTFFFLLIGILRIIRFIIFNNVNFYLKDTFYILQYFFYLKGLLIAIKTPITSYHDSYDSPYDQRFIINTSCLVLIFIAFCITILTTSPNSLPIQRKSLRLWINKLLINSSIMTITLGLFFYFPGIQTFFYSEKTMFFLRTPILYYIFFLILLHYTITDFNINIKSKNKLILDTIIPFLILIIILIVLYISFKTVDISNYYQRG